MNSRAVKRRIRSVARSAFFLGAVSAAVKTVSFFTGLFVKRPGARDRRRRLTAVFTFAAVCGAVLGALAALLVLLRRKRDFYLFDIFDRKGFSTVGRDDVAEVEDAVRAELRCYDDGAASSAAPCPVPLDTEATEDDLG